MAGPRLPYRSPAGGPAPPRVTADHSGPGGRLTITQVGVLAGVEIQQGPHGKCLVATEKFEPGDVVFRGSAVLAEFPTPDLRYDVRFVPRLLPGRAELTPGCGYG